MENNIRSDRKIHFTEDESPAEKAQKRWKSEREALKKAIANTKEKRESLAKLIVETDRKNQKAKLKRAFYVTLIYTAAFFVIAYWQGQVNTSSFESIAEMLLTCFIIGGVFMFFGLLVDSHWITACNAEDKHLENLRKEFEEASEELERRIEEKKRFEENPPYSN